MCEHGVSKEIRSIIAEIWDVAREAAIIGMCIVLMLLYAWFVIAIPFDYIGNKYSFAAVIVFGIFWVPFICGVTSVVCDRLEPIAEKLRSML